MRSLTQERGRLDEMSVMLSGEMVCRWRAVGEEGKIFDHCITRTKDMEAAYTFLKKGSQRSAHQRTVVDSLAADDLPRRDSYLHNIYRKLGLNNRTGLALLIGNVDEQ